MAKVRRYAAMPLPVLLSTTFACVITSPAGGATVTQGTPVTIQGTLSGSAVVVQVKLGSTVLGSASIVGLTWSFSWTPQSGDIGAQTINAVATSPSSEVATAPSVSVTIVSSVVSPLVTMVGNIKAMHESGTGVTISTGANVTGWGSQSPSGSPLGAGGGALFGTDAGGPYIQTTGTHYLQNGWTPPGFGTSPVQLDIIAQQDSFSAAGLIAGFGTGGAGSVRQHATASGQISANNGSGLSTAFALGSFKRVRLIMTGATSGTADSIQVGGASPVTGFLGASVLADLALGAGTGFFFIGKYRAIYGYKVIASGPQNAANDAYYASLYGAGILT